MVRSPTSTVTSIAFVRSAIVHLMARYGSIFGPQLRLVSPEKALEVMKGIMSKDKRRDERGKLND